MATVSLRGHVRRAAGMLGRAHTEAQARGEQAISERLDVLMGEVLDVAAALDELRDQVMDGREQLDVDGHRSAGAAG